MTPEASKSSQLRTAAWRSGPTRSTFTIGNIIPVLGVFTQKVSVLEHLQDTAICFSGHLSPESRREPREPSTQRQSKGPVHHQRGFGYPGLLVAVEFCPLAQDLFRYGAHRGASNCFGRPDLNENNLRVIPGSPV